MRRFFARWTKRKMRRKIVLTLIKTLQVDEGGDDASSCRRRRCTTRVESAHLLTPAGATAPALLAWEALVAIR